MQPSYAEAVDLLYSHNTFHLCRPLAVELLSRVMLPNRLDQIRSIQISTELICPFRTTNGDNSRLHGERYYLQGYHPDDSRRWPKSCGVLQSLSLSRLSITVGVQAYCRVCRAYTVDDARVLRFLEPLKKIEVKDFNVCLTLDISDELIARLGTTPFRISRPS